MSVAPLARRLSLTLLLILAPSLFATLSVSPQLVVLELPQGARKRLDFTVVNEDENNARTIRYYPVPYVQKENGAYAVVDEGDSIFSCHEWFRAGSSKLDTSELQLEPGKGKELSVEIVVPRGVKGTKHGAIAVEMLPTEGRSGVSVGLAMRMPVFVEVTIKGGRLQPRPELVGLEILSAKEAEKELAMSLKDDALGMVAKVKNLGEASFPVRGRILLRDKQGRRLREFPLAGGTILPGAEVRLISVTPGLKPGSYTAEISANCGGASPAKGSVPFEVAAGRGRVSGKLLTAPVLDVGVRDDKLEMTAPAKAMRSQFVVFTNEGDQPRRLRAAVRYLMSDIEGNLLETDTGAARTDCRNWLKLESTAVLLEPGATRPFRVSLEVPEVKPGGRYACLYFEEAGGASGSKLVPSISIPVLVTVLGECEREAEIASVKTATSPLSVRVLVTNKGDVHLTPTGRVQIRAAKVAQPTGADDYTDVGMFELGKGAVVLPGGSVQLTGTHSDILAKGSYRLEVIVDCGKGLKLAESKELVVK